MPADTALPYVGVEVQRHDPDRFLVSLFAPADRRPALWAIHAFNLEIAKTREVVSEPTLGLIRLAWWREAIGDLYAGTVRQHEVVTALAEAIARHGLDRSLFERLIDAREEDLEPEPPATLSCLVNYATVTGGPLVELSLAVLDGMPDEAARASGRAVGTAFALTGLLRSVPFHAAQGRVWLPRDLLDAHGIRIRALLDGQRPDGLVKVVATVAAEAERLLAEARTRRATVARTVRPAFLLAPLTGLYLSALARAGFDPWAARVQMAHPLRAARVGLSALTGRW